MGRLFSWCHLLFVGVVGLPEPLLVHYLLQFGGLLLSFLFGFKFVLLLLELSLLFLFFFLLFNELIDQLVVLVPDGIVQFSVGLVFVGVELVHGEFDPSVVGDLELRNDLLDVIDGAIMLVNIEIS